MFNLFLKNDNHMISSIKSTARTAGLLYLLQIPLGVFGIIYVPKFLIDKRSLSQTIDNFSSNEFIFRLSIVSAIICALVTIATAVYISKILKVVNHNIAKWIVIFTLILAPITMINELNNVAILLIIQKSKYTVGFSNKETEALLYLFLNLHEYGIKMINIFFGLWLLPMGYLVIKSKYIPQIVGYLLLITCVGYLIDFVLFFLFSSLRITISDFTWIGEVIMVLWLLTVGVKTNEFLKYF